MPPSLLFRKRSRSLSAVSEAPTSEELGGPGGLWDLSLDVPVLIFCEFAVAVRALGFQ
jgi:hypothetical protein